MIYLPANLFKVYLFPKQESPAASNDRGLSYAKQLKAAGD